MKKLILSSVFAGLVLASSTLETAATASEKGPYGKFVISGDFGAGWWGNLYHKPKNTVADSSIDTDSITKRQLVALTEAKLRFNTEGGCSRVAFGTVVELDLNADVVGVFELFRDIYVFGRFGDVIEVRVGSQRDAMYSLVDGSLVMGGGYGYNGYYSNLLKSSTISDVSRKQRWVLDLTHANNTNYTNALEVRTTRLAGFQAVLNWKPSSEYNGRLGTYGDGSKVLNPRAQNNLLSAGVNYDNTFGDFRVRASLGGVYGLSDSTTKDGAKAATSLTYRTGGIFSWKTFDIGLGWLDSRSTGFSEAHKDKNAGKALHGAVGYQFDSVALKPRLSVGALWGWKNGRNVDNADNEFKNQDQTIAISGAVDLNIRDGFRWYVEGTLAMLDESNKTEVGSDAGYGETNIIVGTGLAVSQ